jgi:hypothetical protein
MFTKKGSLGYSYPVFCTHYIERKEGMPPYYILGHRKATLIFGVFGFFVNCLIFNFYFGRTGV